MTANRQQARTYPFQAPSLTVKKKNQWGFVDCHEVKPVLVLVVVALLAGLDEPDELLQDLGGHELEDVLQKEARKNVRSLLGNRTFGHKLACTILSSTATTNLEPKAAKRGKNTFT